MNSQEAQNHPDIDLVERIYYQITRKKLSEACKNALKGLLMFPTKSYEKIQEYIQFKNEDASEILTILSMIVQRPVSRKLKDAISPEEAINIIRIKYEGTSTIRQNNYWEKYIEKRCGQMYIMGLPPQKTTDFYIRLSKAEDNERYSSESLEHLVKALARISDSSSQEQSQVDKIQIYGKSGIGKSSLLRYIGIRCLEGKIKGREDCIPIYISLRRLESLRPYPTLFAAIEAIYKSLNVKSEELITILENGKALVLIDGLDVTDKEHSLFLNRVREFIEYYYRSDEQNNRNIFIITTKTKESLFDGFNTYELNEFNKAQAIAFVNKWFNKHEDQKQTGHNLISDLTESRSPKYNLISDSTESRSPKYNLISDSTESRSPKYNLISDSTESRSPKYNLISDSTESRSPKDNLISDLEESRLPIEGYAGVPLLLSCLCLVYTNSCGIEYVKDELLLYRLSMQKLLEDWDRERENNEQNDTYKAFSLKEREKLIGQIAIKLMKSSNFPQSEHIDKKNVNHFTPGKYLNKKDVKEIIIQFIKQPDIQKVLDNANISVGCNEKAEQILHGLELQDGILIEKVENEYVFVHEKIQNYFVSCYLSDANSYEWDEYLKYKHKNPNVFEDAIRLRHWHTNELQSKFLNLPSQQYPCLEDIKFTLTKKGAVIEIHLMKLNEERRITFEIWEISSPDTITIYQFKKGERVQCESSCILPLSPSDIKNWLKFIDTKLYGLH